MRLYWSQPALDELEAIHRYIAFYHPAAAQKIRKEIMFSARKLLEYPEIGRAADRPGVRLLVVTGRPYLLAYTVNKGVIEIGSVIDGRMKRSPDLF